MNPLDTPPSGHDAVSPAVFAETLQLIEDLHEATDCWLDHHGGCQEHGYLHLEAGEKCPMQHAKEFLAQHKPKEVASP